MNIFVNLEEILILTSVGLTTLTYQTPFKLTQAVFDHGVKLFRSHLFRLTEVKA